ncbi:hypothetical protein CLOM_g17266 [Closterium sp. NIES-68]|nr:hypothetical protein CLOM_g17266 [Closterium sp. NIES-68]GJP72676.1 hypothetical protein CLOP_g3442 [Closterium sp. NIES-67]
MATTSVATSSLLCQQADALSWSGRVTAGSANSSGSGLRKVACVARPERSAAQAGRRPAAAARCEATPAATRRNVLLGTASAVSLALAPAPLLDSALALAAPKGYAAHQDAVDRYQFYYPFGWQEVSVRGQDVVFKDVIEPLESVSVNIFPTEKTSLAEIGDINQVAQTLVEKVLTAPSQKTKLIDTRVRELDGRTYYDFEFVAQASSYTRHALGTIAIANGKFYTLTTGANERRWSRVEEKLRTVVASFVTL